MRTSVYKDVTKEKFKEWVILSLANKGYTPTNEMCVRAVEIIKEQDEKIYMLQSSLGMIPKGELHE